MHNYEIVKFLRYMTNCFLPTVFWVMVIFSFDAPYAAILTILTAGIHELGHITAMILLRDKCNIPRGSIDGFRIKNDGKGSYLSEIIILSLGPLANLLAFFVGIHFWGTFHGYIRIFSYLNLATAISNLIPADGHDGYAIIKKILEYRGLSERPLNAVSMTVTIIFTFISLYLILKYASGYWIFGIFFITLLSKISKSVKFSIFRENKRF